MVRLPNNLPEHWEGECPECEERWEVEIASLPEQLWESKFDLTIFGITLSGISGLFTTSFAVATLGPVGATVVGIMTGAAVGWKKLNDIDEDINRYITGFIIHEENEEIECKDCRNFFSVDVVR